MCWVEAASGRTDVGALPSATPFSLHGGSRLRWSPGLAGPASRLFTHADFACVCVCVCLCSSHVLPTTLPCADAVYIFQDTVWSHGAASSCDSFHWRRIFSRRWSGTGAYKVVTRTVPEVCMTGEALRDTFRARMKIRWAHSTHRSRHRCFLFSLSLLAVCLVKLVSIKVTVSDGIYIEPYGITVAFSRFHNRKFEVNCTAIYELDPVEIGKVLEIKRKVVADVSDDSTVSLTSDCEAFVKVRGYNVVPVSEVERSFPLAYSLVVHTNAPMVERILHAIYAPHNIYCIHYDQKSSPAFIKAMKNLARCTPNVFIASKLESVEYAHISRLHADLNCLSDLLKSEVKWKYVINLCGQDFPLKSNYELVTELKQLNGSNMLESSRPSELKKQRFSFQHQLKNVPYEYHRIPVKTTSAKDAPPHGIEMFSGSAYFVLSWEFVSHISSSQVAKDFLAWSADTYSPDEHFWATLVRVPGVPGHIPRSEADITDLRSKTRLVKWNYLEGNLYPACTGTHKRSVCIYGVAELRWLLNYGHWFANKFDPKVDPVLIKCLEEKLMEKRQHVQQT